MRVRRLVIVGLFVELGALLETEGADSRVEAGTDSGSSGMAGMFSEGFESWESSDEAETAGEVACEAGCLTCMARFWEFISTTDAPRLEG